jgi:DNA polymerase III epsilon subunit-like protein
MSTIYPGLTHLNGNLLAAIDFETTGRRPGYSEIIQIAILPLNEHLQPNLNIPPFYHNIRPEYPERCEKGAGFVHGIDIDMLLLHAPSQERVQELLIEWVENLELPQNKVIVPLAHNWAFESSFLKGWLGPDLTDQLFHSHGRDSMLQAIALNDRAVYCGECPPFARVSLPFLCKQLGIPQDHAHDALDDCKSTAELYRTLLTYGL